MFSQYLPYLLEKLHFFKVVTARFLIILFRRKKRIEELYLNYSTEYIFDNSYIIINYRFKNALYYKFDNVKTIENKIKIFDIKNYKKEFNLVVHGLYERKVYLIKIDPENKIQRQNFKTVFNNLKPEFVIGSIPNLYSKGLIITEINPNIKSKNFSINKKEIIIQSYPFNQSDFL